MQLPHSQESLCISTFHAVIRRNHSETHVATSDREHMQSQWIESRSHHHTAMAAMTADSVIAGHPGDAQLVALASQYFRKFDTMAADLSLT